MICYKDVNRFGETLRCAPNRMLIGAIIALVSSLILSGVVMASDKVDTGKPKQPTSAPATSLKDSARTVVVEKTPIAHKARPHKSKTRLYGFITEYYDNNILNYSDSDRATYEALTSTNQRFAIKALADYITDVGLRFTYEGGGRRSEMWRLRVKGDATLLANNDYRNYTLWGFEIRRNIHRSHVELGVTYLPKYNLRNLSWRPMPSRPLGERYTAAEFKRLTYDFEFGSALSKKMDWRMNFSLGSTDYKIPFDERDNTTLGESTRLTLDLSKRATIYGGFGFRQSRADGRNMAVELVNDINYANPVQTVPKDISYNAKTAEIGWRMECDRRGRIVAASSFDYQNQKYTSQEPLDTGHFDRVDHDYDLDLSLSWRVSDVWQPELNYAYRSSSSTVVAGAGEFGSFSGYRLGMQLTAYF